MRKEKERGQARKLRKRRGKDASTYPKRPAKISIITMGFTAFS